MTAFIALLRGINVGGHKPVAMADLRAMLTELGFDDPKTLLQSGNAVFRSGRSASAIEKLLEHEMAGRLGVETRLFVRTRSEWQAIIARNPFPKAAADDPARLALLCLKNAPQPAQVKKLEAALEKLGPALHGEEARVIGREAYLIYPNGMGTSKLTGGVVEKALGTAGTARNWNTVLKLAAAAAG